MAVVLAHLGAAKIVQAFLTTAEMDRAGALTRAGFQHVTRVWEMRAATAVSGSSTGSQLDLTAYPAVDPIEFLDVLVRCHEESLDCPELNGLRTPEELLTGYRECAPDPARWWLARRAGEAIGALILGQGELVFVGVTPNCRGCGFGRELLHFARASATPLSLIVDARNTPAIRLYSSLDFATVGSREVFLLAPSRSAGGR
jgi:GNAT superfamily N-acetyltransferase